MREYLNTRKESRYIGNILVCYLFIINYLNLLNMKKLLIFLTVISAMMAAVIAVKTRSQFNEQFDANIEALAEGEIIVGTLCMQAKDRACSSLGEVYPEHYPA